MTPSMTTPSMQPDSQGIAQGHRVLVMAGGTGGHVFPALSVADYLHGQGALVTWLGTRKGIEAQLVPARGYAIDFVTVRPLRGTGMKARWHGLMRVMVAFWEAVRILRQRKPDVVLGLGGFVSGPGGAAAFLMRVPLAIHEQNTVPGTTNRILSRLASQVMEAFPGTFPPQRHARLTGNPVREDIIRLPVPELRFGQRKGRLRLLIIGGSQGAQALNETVPAAVARLDAALRPEIWHQTGRGKQDAAHTLYKEAGIEARVEEFIDDMARAYEWADLVVARSGAMTVSEIAAAGLGAILVPYPHAVDDHQTTNAQFLADADAAKVFSEETLSISGLADTLRELFTEGRRRLLKMAQAARALARPDTTEAVALTCLEISRGR